MPPGSNTLKLLNIRMIAWLHRLPLRHFEGRFSEIRLHHRVGISFSSGEIVMGILAN
jgi:hypothetical protein